MVVKNTGDPSKVINNCESIAQETESKQSLVFFGQSTGKFYDMYIDAATKLNHAAEKFNYFNVPNEDCYQGLGDLPAIFMLRNEETPQ